MIHFVTRRPGPSTADPVVSSVPTGAAGSSSRMGRIKQLLPLDDGPVIKYCISSIAASGIEDIVIVLAPGNKELFNTIRGFPLRVAFNIDHGGEMADSVRTGLCQIGPSDTGIAICLSDHPMVSVETFRDLVALHGKSPDKILVPVYQGKKGHPTLFPAPVAKEMFSGLNLRQLIGRLPARVNFLDVPDEGVTAWGLNVPSSQYQARGTAALTLYRLTAAMFDGLMQEKHRDVVKNTLRLIKESGLV